jgi:phage terminase large subunit
VVSGCRRKLLILDVYSTSGVGVEHYAEICHSKPWPRGNDYVPHDAKVKEWGTGRTRTEQMRSHRLNPVLVPMATKMDGIQAVRTTLPLCRFHNRTEDRGIAALEQFRREWDDEKKCFRANEIHDWTSHFADAFRYLSLAWRSAPVLVEEPKQILQPGQVALPPPPMPSSGVRIRV